MNLLSKIFEHRGKILTAAFIIIVILFLKQCNDKKYLEQKAIQNEAFYKEEVTKSKTKDGRYEFEKAILSSKVKQLEEDTSRLAQEVMKLKKDGSKPKVVIVTTIEYRDTGSVINTISQLDTNKYSINFNFVSSDGIFRLRGRNHFHATPYEAGENKLGITFNSDKTFLDDISFDLNLTLGIKREEGIDRVFAKTNSDKINITKLDAVEVEDYYKNKYFQKKKKFGVGVYAGFGTTIISNKVYVGPNVGMGIQYNFIRF